VGDFAGGTCSSEQAPRETAIPIRTISRTMATIMFSFTLRMIRVDRVRISSGYCTPVRHHSHESDKRISLPVPGLTRTLNSIGLLGNRKPYDWGAQAHVLSCDVGNSFLLSGRENNLRQRSPMRPIDEQTILITGATSGLGRELAKALAKQGATLLLHGRDAKLGLETVQEIKEATGNAQMQFFRANLSSLREVDQLARQVISGVNRLDVLVNNAGVGFGRDASNRELSEDGHELRFAVNYLAPYLFTERLIPLLKASVPARIVNVASVGQAPLRFENLMFLHGYDGVTAYRQSKLAMVAWTFDLAHRLAGTGVTVNALHPASLMPTKMVLEAGWQTMSSVEEGLKATLRLVIDPSLEEVTGEYFDGLQPARANDQAYDKKVQQRLAALSQELVTFRQTD
jgi:NAD(P)-dependent dehydrogenase (short-subunit alcohol dehydrogenase family)